MTPQALHLMSGGAAKGLVGALRDEFAVATGLDIHGVFGAVGAMRERLLAGDPCDVVVLTAALIDALTIDGLVLAGTAAPLGRVRTGIAVRDGDPLPAVDDAMSLADALLAAEAIHFPDPRLATAGIHFVDVLRRLGIEDRVASALRPHRDGATAMRHLSTAPERHAIGCTQITEIRYTEGVTLVGPLPAAFELATVYTAAVCARTSDPFHAAALVALLSGPRSLALRTAGGFEP